MRSFYKRIGMSRNQWGQLRQKVMKRDGYRCRECGFVGRFEVDHIIPTFDGGTNDLDNLQTLCRSCHIDKTKAERKAKQRPIHHDGWAVLLEDL